MFSLINLKIEFRLSLSVIYLIGFVSSLLFVDTLKLMTTICFASACLILFVIFAIAPLSHEHTRNAIKNSEPPAYDSLVRDEIRESDADYQRSVVQWLEAAVALLAIGGGAFLFVHFL